MFTGMNKIFEKHQKLLLTVVGIIIVIPFIGFVPGADLFDLFSQEQQTAISINGEELDSEIINDQLKFYQAGLHIGIRQGYQENLEGHENLATAIALNRFALIKKLHEEYDFSAISKDELKEFLEKKFGSLKTAKLYIANIQGQLGLTPKKVDQFIIENYFIEKNEEILKNNLVVSEDEIKKAYFKENMMYSISSLKFSSSDSEFWDEEAQKYYQDHKKDFPHPKALQVSYIAFNKSRVNEDEIDNLSTMIKKRFNINKEKYAKESIHKKIGVIGFTINDFLDSEESTAKRKIFEGIKKQVKEKGFERVINTQKNLDYYSTYWGEEENNPFYNSVKYLKKGAISHPLKIHDLNGYKDGYYLIQVIDEKNGILTPSVQRIIKKEVIDAINKKRNLYLAKSFLNSLQKALPQKQSLNEKFTLLKSKAKVLKLEVRESPLLDLESSSQTYKEPFLKAIKNLSEKTLLSKIFDHNSTPTIAFFKAKGPFYKPFRQVKFSIKDKIYENKAREYFKENKELYKIPQTKYGYVVNFYPDINNYKINDKEALKFYKNNQDQFDKKQVRILTISLNFNRRNKEQKKSELQKILAEIKAKKITFQEAIKKYSSKSPEDKKDGEWITENQHKANDIIFATQKHEISMIYDDKTAFEIYKIEEKNRKIPYPRAKDNIIKNLQNEKALKDATRKKNNFYNQLEITLASKEHSLLTNRFLSLAKKNGYRAIPISTQNNFSYYNNVIDDLAIRDEDNPLIINEDDFFVGCYEKTVLEHYPKFDSPETFRKVINEINKQEAIEKLNKKFNNLLPKINSSAPKQLVNLRKQYKFESEEARAFKDLPTSYQGAIESEANKQVFNTSDQSNEHIIFIVTQKQLPSNNKFDKEKENFKNKYYDDKEQEKINQFYQEFTSKNLFSL